MKRTTKYLLLAMMPLFLLAAFILFMVQDYPPVFITLLVLILLILFFVLHTWNFRPLFVNHFFEKTMLFLVKDNPEICAQLKLPLLGDLHKDDLTSVSLQSIVGEEKKVKDIHQQLKGYNFKKLTQDQQVSYAVMDTYLASMDVYLLHAAMPGFAYKAYINPFDHLNGMQIILPEILDKSHEIANTKDAQKFLSRLEKVAEKIQQGIQFFDYKKKENTLPPKAIFQIIIDQLEAFNRVSIDQHSFYTIFSNKLAKIDLADSNDLLEKAQQIIATSIVPAYTDLIKQLQQLKTVAPKALGLWQYKDGPAYYKEMLKTLTTTNMTAEAIHQFGKDEIERIHQIVRKEYFDEAGIAAELTFNKALTSYIDNHLNQQLDFLSSPEDCLQYARKTVENCQRKLPGYFQYIPDIPFEIQRFPSYAEEAAPFAKYMFGAMDGSKPGQLYFALNNLSAESKLSIAATAIHEGIPGHHHQMSQAILMKGRPSFRKLVPFNAYMEGWALYTEWLANEMDVYLNPKIDNLGRYLMELRRAGRLVADTGIHYYRWETEAIDFLVDHTGMGRNEAEREVYRYVAWPAQACSYKIGMKKILELRAMAEKRLGPRFDLKEFHEAILSGGALPLTILEDQIEAYITNVV